MTRVLARRLFAGAVSLAVTLSIALVPSVARADGPTVVGAGSTWSQNAIDQWRVDAAKQGINISYQGVGSSSGRQFYWQNNVDFAVSEIPFQQSELGAVRSSGRSYQYLPIVAGGTSLMYNVTDSQGRRITNLTLSPATIAGIFTGSITDWSDHRITADYGKALPAGPIKPVIRSDGSGTSAQFSAWIKFEEPSVWSKFARDNHIPNEPTSFWPIFGIAIAQRGSDGVANYVANSGVGKGSITYVEYSYAKQRHFPVVSVENSSHHFVQPTAENVAIALQHATLNKDETQNLSGVYQAKEAAAYPISSYSYMIAPTNDIDPAKGAVLGKFMMYFSCQGQQAAAPLGYSPLPPNLVKVVWDSIARMKGAPSPPNVINKSNCPNPTVTGSFNIGSGGDPGTTGGGAGTTTTGPSSGASSDASLGPSDSASTQTISVSPTGLLASDSMVSLQALAAEEIGGAKSGSTAGLLIAAGVVLLLIFGPLFLRLRAGRGDD